MGKVALLIVFFVLSVIGVSVYPLIEVINTKVPKRIEHKNIIPTVISEGNYSIYKPVLEREGSFKRAEIFSKTYIKTFDLWLIDYIKEEKIFGREFIYKNRVLKGDDIKYFSNEYNLSAAKGLYFLDNRILKGDKFFIVSASFKGEGESFLIDKEKNIFANRIVYYLKVKQ